MWIQGRSDLGEGENVPSRGNSKFKGSKVGTVLVCTVMGSGGGQGRKRSTTHESRAEARENSGCPMNLMGVGQTQHRHGHQRRDEAEFQQGAKSAL